MIVAVAVCLAIARSYPRVRLFVPPFLFVLLGAQPLLAMSVEYRSFMLVISANAVMLVCFYAMFTVDRRLERRDLPLVACLLLATICSFNTHYVASLVGGLLAAAFIALFWFTGRPQWSLTVLATSAFAGAILVVWFVLQHHVVASTAATYWAHTSTKNALSIEVRFLAMMAVANVVVAILALGRLGKDRHPDGMNADTRRFALTCVIVIVVACAGLLILNHARPFMQTRYLSALIPIAAGALAAVVADRPMRGSTVWMAFAATISSLLLNTLFGIPASMGWDISAAVVAGVVRQCPSTVVHARPYWQVNPTQTQQLGSESAIIDFGYAREAALHGFTVEPRDSVRLSRSCPTIVWLAHVPTLAAIDVLHRAGLPMNREQIARARTIPLSFQQLVIIPPDVSRSQPSPVDRVAKVVR